MYIQDVCTDVAAFLSGLGDLRRAGITFILMPKRTYTEGTWRADPWFRALCNALAACKTETQVADFLRDVATLSEMRAMSERLEVARRIAAGQTYRQISKETGASTTTVTRVGNFLMGGAGGYRKSLNYIVDHHHHSASKRGRRMVSVR